MGKTAIFAHRVKSARLETRYLQEDAGQGLARFSAKLVPLRESVTSWVVIHSVALQIALAAPRAERRVLQQALDGGTDHELAATIAQHEVDQVRVLARAVGVMAGRAGRLFFEMFLVGESPSLIVRKEAAIVALVAQVVVLR